MIEPSRKTTSADRQHQRVNWRIVVSIVVVAVGLALSEQLVHKDPEHHPHFDCETWPAFHLWFPLLSVFVVVAVAHAWRLVVGFVHGDNPRAAEEV